MEPDSSYTNQDPDLAPPKKPDDANLKRLLAGAEAVGILGSLLDFGYVPSHHQESAKRILKNWEDA